MTKPDNSHVDLQVGTPPDDAFEPVHIWLEKCQAGFRLRASRGEHEAALLLIRNNLEIQRYVNMPVELGFTVDGDRHGLLLGEPGMEQPVSK